MITTAASCGAVNAMHDSFTALGGMIPIINMELGEIVIGGVGAGLYGMLLFVIIAIFVAGLMVGRTPEYVGKKIEAKEVKMTMLAILVLPLSMLGFTALAVVLPTGTASILNPGPHGFSEVLYAYTSATANNGSAFGGLTGNTPFYNTTLGLAMLIGRFMMIVPMLAVAGSLAAKKIVPTSAGTFPTHGGLFVGLLVGVDPDRRRPDLLPRPRVRTGRGALRGAGRHALLGASAMATLPQAAPPGAMRRRDTSLSFLDASIVVPALGAAFRSSTRGCWFATRSCSWSRSSRP